MGAFLVVEVYGLVSEQAGLGQVFGQEKEEFIFENFVNSFGQFVLVAAVGHQAAPLRFFEGCLMGIGDILAAVVEMVNATGGPAPGPVQSGQAAGGMQAGVVVMADYASGKRIGDQAQVAAALAGG